MMSRATDEGRKKFRLCPLRVAHRGLGAFPEAVGNRTEAHPSILARIDPRQPELGAGADAHSIGRVCRLMGMNSYRGPEHADHREPRTGIDMLAPACALALKER